MFAAGPRMLRKNVFIVGFAIQLSRPIFKFGPRELCTEYYEEYSSTSSCSKFSFHTSVNLNFKLKSVLVGTGSSGGLPRFILTFGSTLNFLVQPNLNVGRLVGGGPRIVPEIYFRKRPGTSMYLVIVHWQLQHFIQKMIYEDIPHY